MIEVKHLTKRYGAHTAVEDLSFRVEDGRIYGLLGPNGAGKSTTMNIITGYLSPTSGTVLVDGHDILEEPEAAKRCIGYLPEQPPLYPDMTVREYLRFAAELKRVPRAERSAQVEKVIRRTGLATEADRIIKQLSKGFKQRVGVAQALLGAPKVIILDEPTVGLDPAQVIEFRRLIRELGRSHTVILSSHILSEVQAVCDQVLIIAHGRLTASGTPDQLSDRVRTQNVLRVTALGSWAAVRQSLRSVRGAQDLQLEQEQNEEVTFCVRSKAGLDLRAAVSKALSKAGCAVLGMTAETMSLEDVFLQLTEREDTAETDEDGEEAEAAAEESGAKTNAEPEEADADAGAQTQAGGASADADVDDAETGEEG